MTCVDRLAPRGVGPDRFRAVRGCRWPPTSRGRRCAGCSTNVSGAAGARRRGRPGIRHDRLWVLWRRATRTASPTSPTSPTPPAPCSWISPLSTGTPRPVQTMASRGRCSRRSGRRSRRTGRRHRAPGRRADGRHPRRPAGGDCSARPASRWARPRTPTAPVVSCSSTPAPSWSTPPTASSPPSLPDRRPGAGVRPGRLDRHRGRPGAVAARQPGDHHRVAEVEALAGLGRPTTATSISCPPSPGCSPRTGVRTPAG
jgi:hypothetical protein